MIPSDFSLFLSGLTSEFVPVIDSRFSREDYVHVDLSETNEGLKKINIASSEEFSKYISEFLLKKGRKVAFGGYNEVRELYRRSGLFNTSEAEGADRNIHIGIDLWAKVGTTVLAVLDGKIHSFMDNSNFGDYGPTIILEHQFKDQKFYSLYGHLSRSSLKGIVPGQEVRKGEKIAELGSASENGDYAPHLHFQIIRDMQGKKGDYPGVASRKEIDFYLNNCPDPDILLKIR